MDVITYISSGAEDTEFKKDCDALLLATLEVYAPIEVLSEYMGYRGDKDEDKSTESSVLAKEGDNTTRRAD